APPERRDDGSTASTATERPSARQARTSSLSSVDLPAPGGPVIPTMWAGASPPSAAGAVACRSAATSSRALRFSTRLSTAGAAEDREPDHVDALLQGAGGDLRRRQPDAVVDDVHAGVARADCDLLGAVGVAVEPGLADEDLERAPESLGDALDLLADGRKLVV